MSTMIAITRINGTWEGMVDNSGEWLPLPFTPDADRQMIMAFYEERFPVVIMKADCLGW